MGDCAIDKGSLILLLPLKTLFKFTMFINKEWLWEMLISNTYKMFTNDPKDVHKNHMRQPTYPHFDIIIIGDSITTRFSHYSNASETFFKESLNLGIGGDRTHHILW